MQVLGLESGTFRAGHRPDAPRVRGCFGVSGERGLKGIVGSGTEPDGRSYRLGSGYLEPIE